MKILIDLTSLADNYSGIERYAACISKELIKRRNDEFILLFKEVVHSMFAEFQSKTNIEFVVIPRCKKIIFNQIKLPMEIYKHEADWYLFLAFPVPILLFKKNMVSTIHDICCWDCPETMNGLSNWYFKISHIVAMKKCKAIITISEFSKQRIIDKLNYPKEKIWLVYCGVDEKFLNYEKDYNESKNIKEKYGLPDRYLLSLSTLEPRKNLRLLVAAYEELMKEQNFDLPLVLAGRKGWKMDELLSGIDKTLADKIIFTGFIDDQDLPAIYGNSTLFVFPSIYEGFGMPPLEALACGTTVISSNSSSLPEVLGNAVIYFDNDNVNSLVLAMKNYELNTISENARREQINRFDWNIEAKKVIQYMRRAIR